MREPPSGAELLQVASEVMRRDLLPSIPEAHRYAALMVLRAMAIAERELRHGDDSLREERLALAAMPALGAQGTLEELAAALTRGIRRGDYDQQGEERSKVREFLLEAVRRRLSETNPRYLAED